MAVSRPFAIAAALLLAAPTVAWAQQIPVHSDLPLWTLADNNVFPRGFSSEDETVQTLGAAGPLPSGDWRCVPEVEDESETCDDWLRIELDGVFHPKYIVSAAADRAGLKAAPGRLAYVVLLFQEGAGAKMVRVFALEEGFRPGSDYRVFAVRGDGDVRRLEMLDLKCRGAGRTWRERNMGMWLTGYCAVDGKAALKAMAREALSRKPAAVFEYAPEPAAAQTTPEA